MTPPDPNTPVSAPKSLLVKRPGLKPVLMQITPKLTISGPLPAELRPRFGLVSFKPLPDGTLLPVLKTHDEWERLTESLPGDLRLGISYDTLKRLCKCGIVLWRQIAPGSYQINLHSLDAHLTGCAADPEYYWNTPIRWPDGRTLTRRQKFTEGA